MSKRTFPLAFAALLSLCPLSALAQGPTAAPASEAGGHFKRGLELYGEGDFSAALIEFRRAYELDPRFQALYNLGETQFQLQDYASALKTLEKYLKEGGADVPAERRETVQKEIEKLRSRVATLDVTTSVPGVELAVDDVPVGKTPLAAPLTVSAGRRRLTATLPGKPAIVQVLELAGGDTKKLALVLPEAGAAAPPAAGGGSPSKSVPAAPWVVTGVLTAGAVVTGVLALSASSNLTTQLGKAPGNADDIASAHKKTFAFALTTDILAGAAIVMAGVSIYFTSSALSSGKADTKAARLGWIGGPGPSMPGMVRLDAGPRGVAFTGRF